ncbi:MAG: tetratricopeptide repeat protein [Rhodospirillaceae bacterium]|nr:tetratricopeptide repeat protein [Rhodospirillaceae bacterium]
MPSRATTDSSTPEAVAAAKQVLALKRTVAAQPRDAAAHFQLAGAYASVGDAALAERHLRRAAQLEPTSARVQIALGVLLTNQGEYDPAMDCFRAALRSEPANLDALANLGEVQLHVREYTAAAATFATAARLSPDSLPTGLALAFAEEKRGNLQAAVATYRALAARFPENAEIRFRLGEALIKAEPDRIREHLTHLDDARQRDPGNLIYFARTAILNAMIGDDERRFAALHSLLSLPTRTPDDIAIRIWALIKLGKIEDAFSTPHPALNLASLAEQDAVIAAGLPPAHRPPPLCFVGRAPAAETDRPLVFAVASGDYAQTYAPDFVSSGIAKVPGCDFHVHLMDPGSADPKSLAPEAPAERLTWSAETLERRTKGIYAARRFLRLPDLLRTLKRPIVCVDIDSLFVGDFSGTLATLQPFDAAVHERRSEFRVQQLVSAGFFAVSPSAAGLAFADFAASYIAYFESSGRELWFIDQVAIVAAKLWIERNWPSARIASAPEEILDWSPNGESAKFIWTAKGAVKFKRDRHPQPR